MVGLVGGSRASTGATLALVSAKAVGFLAGALVLGRALAPSLFRLTARLKGRGVIFTAALVTCFVLSWVAHAVGLAPIVGAIRRIVAHVAPAPGRHDGPAISPYASCFSTARPFPSG